MQFANDEAQSDASEAKTYSVEFVRSDRTFTCADDENVLDAAYAAGLSPCHPVGRDVRHPQDNGALRHRGYAAQRRHPAT